MDKANPLSLHTLLFESRMCNVFFETVECLRIIALLKTAG